MTETNRVLYSIFKETLRFLERGEIEMEPIVKGNLVLIKLRGDKSRVDVAYDLKITPQMLGAIERRDRTPSLHLAKKIANYYGSTIEDIFFTCKETKCVL